MQRVIPDINRGRDHSNFKIKTKDYNIVISFGISTLILIVMFSYSFYFYKIKIETDVENKLIYTQNEIKLIRYIDNLAQLQGTKTDSDSNGHDSNQRWFTNSTLQLESRRSTWNLDTSS